jgi:hypothetical protein
MVTRATFPAADPAAVTDAVLETDPEPAAVPVPAGDAETVTALETGKTADTAAGLPCVPVAEVVATEPAAETVTAVR